MKRFAVIFFTAALACFLTAACIDSSDKSTAGSKDESGTPSQKSDHFSAENEPKLEINSVDSNRSAAADKESSLEEQDAVKDNGDENIDIKVLTNNENTASKQKEYLKILDEIEKELQNKPEGTTTREMKEYETEKLRIWDKALNEIYSVLKEQLSPDEMMLLRDEQRSWIRQRDEAAITESSKYEGGSMESLTYAAAKASMTKMRCYELVENYMN